MGLLLSKVTKVVGSETHLKDITIEFEDNSCNILLGRTLAGKTSLLRIMAGLDRPTSGNVMLNGKDVTGVSVRKRNVAMVYQQFINYPSLSIYNNIASPLKMKGMDKKEIDRRVREAAQMLRIENLLDRLPAELSGGQQQRTAIARAIVKDAKLLLLDEPLVNLDYKLREELRTELRSIFETRDTIVVYTTTEPSEALMFGGSTVVIDEGRVLQSGLTPHVYRHPATLKVAEVFSDPPINYLDCAVKEDGIRFGEAVHIPLTAHMKGLTPGKYHIGVRANHLFLNRKNDDDVELKGNVALSEINGSETFTHVDYGDSALVVQDDGIHSHKIGSEISIFLNPSTLYIYDSEGALAASPDA